MAEPKTAPPDYMHVARARSPRGMLALAVTWGSACVLLLGFQALPIITLLLFLAGLPLAYDLLRDRENSFSLTADTIAWETPTGGGELLLNAVAHAHLTFRLDLSAKLGLRLRDGRLITVPLSCLPGPHSLERALLDRDIKVVRGRQPLG